MKNLFFRKAIRSDANQISKLMLLAMEEIIYELIGEKSKEKAINFLTDLIGQEENQYTYKNCWLVEVDHQPIGVANVYDGANLKSLRKPVLNYLRNTYNREISIEDETDASEYYIDSIAIDPLYRGKGIGTLFLQFLIKEYANKNKPLGLLVDKDNPKAKKLYLSLGFKKINEMELMHKKMEHLQYSNKPKTIIF